jgi:hypothetical protein
MSFLNKYPASIPEYVRPAETNDLKATELFEEVDESSLSALVGHSKICKLGGHKSLSYTRDGVDYVYIIISGYVAIWLPSHLIYVGQAFSHGAALGRSLGRCGQ